jgi:hypothetical protein
VLVIRGLVLLLALAVSLVLMPALGHAAPKRKGGSVKGTSTTVLPSYPKAFQKRHRTGPKSDPDRDGLTSYYEYLAKTHPRRRDSDRDGVLDGREDRDGDGLRNRVEQWIASNPGSADTNRNGRRDGREDRDHDGLANLDEQSSELDPRDRDSDDDGIRDGDEYVGRVVDFDPDAGTVTLWMAAERLEIEAAVGGDVAVVCVAPDDDDPYEDEEESEETGDEPGDLDEVPGDDDDGAEPEADSTDDESGISDDLGDEGDAEDGDGDDDASEDCDADLEAGQWFTNAEFSEDDDGLLTLELIELS